jgi:hypothetical protein
MSEFHEQSGKLRLTGLIVAGMLWLDLLMTQVYCFFVESDKCIVPYSLPPWFWFNVLVGVWFIQLLMMLIAHCLGMNNSEQDNLESKLRAINEFIEQIDDEKERAIKKQE